MNNKKRPAVSSTTLTRRYSRRISANNNAEASLDDCVDDIILSIASYLASCELFNFALTCKRFGARSTVSANEEDEQQEDDISESNVILSSGSRAFARPATSRTPEPQSKRDREGTFVECRIIDHSHITESYRVKFQNEGLKLHGDGIQWIGQNLVVSTEDMIKRVEQSLRFCVKRDGDTISIYGRFMADNQPWEIESKFVKEVGNRLKKRIRLQLESRDWSLMEEAALQKSLNLLSMSMNSSEEGCLMWREGESWMGICHQFEQELELLEEAGDELEKEEPNETDATDLDQFLDRTSELSQYYANDIEQLLSRDVTIATRFFQQYSFFQSHTKGVSSMVGLYENAMSGVLVGHGMRRRIQIVLLLACLRSRGGITGPFIIVAPLSLVPHWVMTFNQYSDMPISCLTGTEEEREAMYRGRMKPSLNDYYPRNEKNAKYPVVITSYEAAISDRVQYEADFRYFIMDEGEGFERYRRELLCHYFLEGYRASNRLFLTSRPIKSDLKELTILWRFCNPRICNYEHLLDDYDDNEKQTFAAKLQNILKPHIVCSGENREETTS